MYINKIKQKPFAVFSCSIYRCVFQELYSHIFFLRKENILLLILRKSSTTLYPPRPCLGDRFKAHVYLLLGLHLNNAIVYSEQAMFFNDDLLVDFT